MKISLNVKKKSFFFSSSDLIIFSNFIWYTLLEIQEGEENPKLVCVVPLCDLEHQVSGIGYEEVIVVFYVPLSYMFH